MSVSLTRCWHSSRCTRCAPRRYGWRAASCSGCSRSADEPAEEPEGGWPGISVLIPAYNEESVIALSVTAALASDYPVLEVLVLDDGSSDGTEAAALAASRR